ncbi:MAG: DUF3344 domain-containing protein [Anaerotignum sp.]|nr:DUF3344 domain-containing protein [Anaerotignum sp.]
MMNKNYSGKGAQLAGAHLFLTGGSKPLAHLLLIAILVLLFMIATPAAADPYYGGTNLTTENGTYGMVTGDLWFDIYPGMTYAPIVKNSTLPCGPGDVAWARLYIAAYIGSTYKNNPLNVTTEFDGGSGYETLGSEIMNTTYTVPFNDGNWDGEGIVWINDHCNRVTSDFLIWYDVDDLITSSNVSTRVNEDPDAMDGRVKMITLVVAYNNQSSCKVIQYWVNQGHDIESSQMDEAGNPYIGNTTFNTSVICSPGEANLTTFALSSCHGSYTFKGVNLTWTNPSQGPYYQWQSWNVTSLMSCESDSYMTYSTNYYTKATLALLTVEDEYYIYDFSNNTLGRAGISLFAYRYQTSALPPTIYNDPNIEYTDAQYEKIKFNDGVFQSDATDTNGKRAAHRFVFNVSCCNASDLSAINATWDGKGWHDAGGNSNGAYLYIWNYTSQSYEYLDDCDSVGTEEILTGEKTANLSNYINNGKIIVLAEQKSSQSSVPPPTKKSYIATDYIKLTFRPLSSK